MDGNKRSHVLMNGNKRSHVLMDGNQRSHVLMDGWMGTQVLMCSMNEKLGSHCRRTGQERRETIAWTLPDGYNSAQLDSSTERQAEFITPLPVNLP